MSQPKSQHVAVMPFMLKCVGAGSGVEKYSVFLLVGINTIIVTVATINVIGK